MATATAPHTRVVLRDVKALVQAASVALNGERLSNEAVEQQIQELCDHDYTYRSSSYGVSSDRITCSRGCGYWRYD